jgi:bifunctional NMN adenylyltransferase/nudix hydrolase
LTHDTAVLIGRFQPYHNGHAALLSKAFATAPRVVVVLGSAFAAPSPRNAFTAEEREEMIRDTLSAQENDRLRFHAQRDVWDAVRWARDVQAAIDALEPGRVALVGYHKDASSSYLQTFPEWDLVDTGRLGPLDATPLREQILSNADWQEVERSLSECVPDATLAWLSRWAQGNIRQILSEDRQAILDCQDTWGTGPFVTVDAVVSTLGHVLLIRRGKKPGQRLLALPGGFLDPHESLEAGARRELLEETGLDLSGLSAVREQVFSHPGRSQRGRILTHAFLFAPHWASLPDVAGDDDAVFFADHWHILEQLLPNENHDSRLF